MEEEPRRVRAGNLTHGPGPSRPRFSIDNLQKCSSQFGKYEEQALKIEIAGTDDLEDIFPGRREFPVPSMSEHLLLEGFSYNEIITFAPTDDSGLSTQQIRFLRKLQRVLLNNAPVTPMMDILFTEAGLDEGVHLEMVASVLNMTIGARKIAVHVDKEGRMDNKIIWAANEIQHALVHRYKGGLVQLIASLITGCQQNYGMANSQIVPKAMYGFNVRGGQVSIVRTEFTIGYIESLFGGLPTEPLYVSLYPSKSGLVLADPAQRRQLLGIMSALREEALSINVGSITRTLR